MEYLSSGIGMKFEENVKKVGIRLKEVRLRLDKGSQAQFAGEFGLEQTTLSKYEKGTLNIPDTIKLKLGEFGINLHWLLTGEGEMFLASVPAFPAGREVAKAGEGGYKVPLLRQKVSCGPGVNWQDEANIVEYIDVFDLIPRLKIKRMFALCVEGSSMLGAGIRNGDYVLFDSAQDQWPHDGIYVFALDGEVYCKRMEFDMTKIKIYSVRFTDLDKAELMITLDTDDISTADRLTILGRVLYWVHPNVE
jgi:SOS-response transcriptional repressor LexA